MKNFICISLIFTTLLMILPLCAVKRQNKVIATAGNAVSATVFNKTDKKPEKFKVLISDSKKIEVMTADEYIFGVVAAEMPISYEIEALKAQTVAAYSFATIRKAQNKDLEYDISTDISVDQSYVDRETLKEKWGDNYEEYSEKLSGAIKSVSGKVATYNGDIALTVYHAVSSGKTENSNDIWGGKYEYLVSVDSVWDKLCENYLSTVIFDFNQLKEKLGEYDFLSGEIKIQRTKSGSVKTLIVDGKEISGELLREKLNLASANFTPTVQENGVCFEVKGYGHGVGMSQYGANYMAKQGANYKEILKHYYKNIKIE